MYLMKTIQVYRRDMPVKKQEMTEHTYGITAHVVADINLTIRAKTMEDALSKAKDMKVPDVVKNIESYMDYEDPVVISIWKY